MRLDEPRPAPKAGGVTGGLTCQRPFSRAETFRQFTDFEDPGHEAEDAVAALAFLLAEKIVEVAGDEIRVTARFWIPAAV